MQISELPPQEILEQLISYDPKTGLMFWKERPLHFFKDGRRLATTNQSCWNAKNAGKEALNVVSEQGYRYGRLFNRIQYAHRIAFKLWHGVEPMYVDHINRIKTDNRISNLRSVTNAENAMNQRTSVRNKSGFLGICRVANMPGKWRASVGDSVLGYFDDLEEAVAARRAAEAAYWSGRHQRHPPRI